MRARPPLLAFAGPAAIAGLLFSQTASAQDPIMESDWRQKPSYRDGSAESNFAFELRFGPYWPAIDSEFDASPGPYETVFDNDPQFYFGFEFDWLPLQIPYVGGVGPGIGWGYTAVGTTPKISGTNEESGDETSLTIMPMHLSAVVRGDALVRKTGVPIIPYGKFGLGFATWDATTSSGTSEVNGVLGRDTTWGFHLALGVALSMNFLDPSRLSSMEDGSGVKHVTLFGEWMHAALDGIGSRPQMHVGTSTFVGGLGLMF